MSDLLIAMRAVHITATVLFADTIVFTSLVVAPVLRRAHADPLSSAWCSLSARIAWIALATAVVSGAAWLVVLAAQIGRRPLSEVFSDDIVWSVWVHTRFGLAWCARLVMATLLAFGLVARDRRPDTSLRWQDMSTVALAMMFIGSLAWSGHASGTPGPAGYVHVAADVLHLVAAGAWVGALVPLALLFAVARRSVDPAAVSVAHDVTVRFSALGVIAVGTILVTGAINALILVGSVPALVGTDYGRLLMVKIVLFLAMVCIAAFSRLRLTPQLSSARDGADALRQLRRNSLIEAAMGLLILGIVGALGTLPPALHAVPSAHVHGT